MTAPTVIVELGLDATASGGSAFILDHPVRGVLDNTDWTLAGTQFVDVTDHLSGQVTTTRGRSREVDKFQAGTASFTLRNEDRSFDPSNTAGPYYPGPLLRTTARISAGNDGLGTPHIFTGYVDDISVNYEQPNICTTTFSLVDAFTLLANIKVTGFALPAGTTGDAISAILTYTGLLIQTDIDPGMTTIAGRTLADVSALDAIQQLVTTEQGRFFVAVDGTLTFRDRAAALDPTYSITYTDADSSAFAPFSVGYQNISQRTASTLLFNTVTAINATGGTSQSVSDTTSISTYLERALDVGTVESASDSSVLDLCRALLVQFSSEEVRFDTVVIGLMGARFGAIDPWLLTDVEIGDHVVVERRPPGSGSPSVISRASIVEGMSYSLDVSGASTLTLNFGNFTPFFILDDPLYGILDLSRLNY